MLFFPRCPTKKQLQVLKDCTFPLQKSFAIALPDMRVIPWYFEKGSHWVEVRKGRVSVSQLDGSDAKRPDIAAGIVGRVQLLLTGYYLQTAGGVVKENRELYE